MSHHRKNLLSGTSTLVLVSLLGASAALADATAALPTRDGNNAAVTGAQTMLGRQTNSGTVQAPVSGSTVTNGVPNGQNGAGAAQGSSFTTTTNMIGSSATDNSQVQAITLSLATTAGNGTQPSGIAILGVQNNTGRAVSSVTASSIAANLTANGGTVAENGNTISATTALNQGTNQSIGTVPQNFAPTGNPNGTVAFNAGNGAAAANALQAAGGVIVSSAQTNGNSTFTNPDGTTAANGAASSARLGDGTANGADSITLTVAPQGGTFTGNPALNSNSLTASFSGNSVTNTIGALDGVSNQIGVPLVVANTQLNSDATPGTGGQGAFNANSAVSATITNPGALAGALAVNNNTISSSATGNDAYAGGTATGGNVIALANTVGLLGTSRAQQNTVGGTTGTAPTANTEADVTVFNAQQNNTGGNSTLTASTTNAQVSSTVNGVNGSVAITGNGITADVRGNRAYNAVLAGGTDMNGGPSTALVDGDIAVNSLQSNSGLAVTATNTGGSIQSTVAAGANQTIAGPVTVTANTIGASAYGNTVTNLVGGTSAAGVTAALEADQLTNGVATGVLTSDRTGSGTATAAAGFSIDNVQANLVGTGGAVNATNNGTVSLTAGNTGAPLTANLSVSANDLLSTAVGNSATSTMALGGNGTNGTPGGSAGVLNQQTSTAPVSAQLAVPTAGNTGITLAATANAFNGTNLSASNEVERALGYGNSAANTLSQSVSTLTAAPSAAANSTAQPAGTATATANGTLTVLSDQLDTAAVTANAVPGVTVTANTGNFNGGSVTALGDIQVAAARGNAVANALTLSGTSVTETGAAPAVASLLNLQTVNGAAISATSAPAGAFVSVTVQGINNTAGGSTTITASNNAQASVATGSDATNGLTVSEKQVAATSTGAFGSATNGTTSAAFALSNNQASTNGGSRNASTTGTGVAVNFGGELGANNATVTVDANSFSAQATDNTAANALNINGGTTSNGTTVAALSATTVQGTAALKSRQDSVAAVAANVGTAGTPVAVTLTPLGVIVGSPLGVDATVFNATATGNNATSTLALVAGIETGAANTAAGNQGAGSATTTTTITNANALTGTDAQRTVNGAVFPAGTSAPLPAGTLASSTTMTGPNGANGDLALANFQTVGGNIQASSVGGVTINNPTSLTNSPVSVTGTAAQAVAKGNLAVDAINATLTGTGAPAPAYALFSNQTGTSPTVQANSVLGIAVPNTTATNILSNSNTAVASLNDATNTVTGYASSSFSSAYGSQNGSASTTTTGQPTQTVIVIAPSGTTPETVNGQTGNVPTQLTTTKTVSTPPGLSSVADLALFNQQTAAGAGITATALTTIGQNAGANIGQDPTSTLNVIGNTTMAQAQANIATNTLTNTLNGVAGNGFAASEALLNNQSSTSNVTAQSSAGAGMPLASLTFTGNTVATSTAELLDNAATAMARGNVASNAADGGAKMASGNIALASLQTNGGAITANGGMTLNFLGTANTTSASTVLANGNTSRAIAGGNTANNAVTASSGAYGASLANGSAGTGAAATTADYAGYKAAPAGSLNANAQYAALNSQVNTGAINATNTSTMLATPFSQGTLNAQVTGNSISSTGYANLANNSIGMTASATGASTSSLTNYQNNTGNVTASVTSSAIGLRSGTAAQTGTLGVNNNAISASATGNSATNIISALPTR